MEIGYSMNFAKKYTINHLMRSLLKQKRTRNQTVLEVLQDWVNSIVDSLNHSSIRTYLAGINRYLQYQKIRINLKDVELPMKINEERYAISIEEITKILDVASYERRGCYLALKILAADGRNYWIKKEGHRVN